MALIGKRRQSAATEPTVGERAAETTSRFIEGATAPVQTFSNGATRFAVGTAESIAGAAVSVTAATARVASRATSTVVVGAVSVLGHAATNTGGLMLDGGTALLESLPSPLRKSRDNTPTHGSTTQPLAKLPLPTSVLTQRPTTRAATTTRRAAPTKTSAPRTPAARRVTPKSSTPTKSSRKTGDVTAPSKRSRSGG